MRDGFLFSAGLHGAVLAVVVFGLPGFVAPLEPQPMIPVELVELKDFIEQTPVAPDPDPVEEPVAEDEAPVPEKQYEPKQLAALPKLPTPTPEPPAPDPESVPDPSMAPETPSQPEPEPAVSVPPPRPKPKPEPEEVVEDTSELPPTPRRKPQLAKLEAPKPPSSLISSILKDVEKLKDEEPPRPKQVGKAETQAETPQSSVLEQMALVRHIQEQMRRCWRLEPGARDAEDLVVRVIVYLNSDGSVRKAEIDDFARATSDSFYRSAAENALRAVHTCSPFEGLPLKRYQVWRELHLTFNPSEMFGS